jgi:hypothetical protein
MPLCSPRGSCILQCIVISDGEPVGEPHGTVKRVIQQVLHSITLSGFQPSFWLDSFVAGQHSKCAVCAQCWWPVVGSLMRASRPAPSACNPSRSSSLAACCRAYCRSTGVCALPAGQAGGGAVAVRPRRHLLRVCTSRQGVRDIFQFGSAVLQPPWPPVSLSVSMCTAAEMLCCMSDSVSS